MQTLPLRARLFLCLITCDTLLDRRQKRGILGPIKSPAHCTQRTLGGLVP